MFIRKIIFILCIIFSMLSVYAQNPYEMVITNNKDIEAKMLFLDKLEGCIPFEYHEDNVGVYKINAKVNNACSIRWIMANCDFPEGVYQEFSRVQKHRTIERYIRYSEGRRNELKDRNYRYLYNTGNKYCQIVY